MKSKRLKTDRLKGILKETHTFVASCNLEASLKWFKPVIRVTFLASKRALILTVVFLAVSTGRGSGRHMDFNKRSVFAGRRIKRQLGHSGNTA